MLRASLWTINQSVQSNDSHRGIRPDPSLSQLRDAGSRNTQINETRIINKVVASVEMTLVIRAVNKVGERVSGLEK